MDPVLMPSSVLNVNVLGNILGLSMHFLMMAFVRMKQTMEAVCLMVLIVVDMMKMVIMILMTILILSLVIQHFAQIAIVKVCKFFEK